MGPILFVICALIYTSHAAVMQGLPSTHEDYPNQCYINEKGYSVGEHNVDGYCERVLCYSNFAFEIHTCGVVKPPTGYHNEIDVSKPYPDCCVNFVKDS